MIRQAGTTRWIVIGALLVLVFAAAAFFTLRAPRVDALRVQAAPLVRTLQFSARVATLSRVDVGSTLTGRVAQVRVREGVPVRRGEPLIQLETAELRAAEAQAVAAERQADATLQAAHAALARAEQLVEQGFYSAAQLDEAQRAEEVAQAQRGAARAAVTAARARLEQARIEAPADARVLARLVEPGQIVQPGKPLMSLALAGPLLLVAQVDERFLDQLRVGQPAMVVADAFSRQRFAARVLSIAPLVDAQRGAIEVKFALDQSPPAFLREDMTLSVEVETGRRAEALVLPLAALRSQKGDGATVLVADDKGRARVRPVQLGLRTVEAVEVSDGLRAGEEVLLGAALRAGQRVRPVVQAWQPGADTLPAAHAEDAGSAMVNAMGR